MTTLSITAALSSQSRPPGSLQKGEILLLPMVLCSIVALSGLKRKTLLLNFLLALLARASAGDEIFGGDVEG